jgi:hypothetical protein
VGFHGALSYLKGLFDLSFQDFQNLGRACYFLWRFVELALLSGDDELGGRWIRGECLMDLSEFFGCDVELLESFLCISHCCCESVLDIRRDYDLVCVPVA